jgi:hypothetical protein
MRNRKARQWLVDAGAILTALVFLVPVGWALGEERRVSTNGQITQGVVLRKERIEGGGEGPASYYVHYSLLALGAIGVCWFFMLGPQRWLRELGGERDPALD